ncbi:MAG: hypothetical protein L0Z50_18850, partial [Verrucomicrobiales bacterium]|nr:hypothetical protein [Verrucomicrobiales bacterium]
MLGKGCLAANASASDLRADLMRFLDHEPVLARRPSLLRSTWRWCRRNSLTRVVAAGIAVVIASGMVATAWHVRETEAARRACATSSRSIPESSLYSPKPSPHSVAAQRKLWRNRLSKWS